MALVPMNIQSMIIWLFATSLFFFQYGCEAKKEDISAYNFTACATPSFRDGDHVDLDKMLYDCMDHIPSTLFPPSYFSDKYGNYRATNVSVQIALNNIIHVDDLTSQFTMDFFFRILWTDPRLVMPEVWNHLHPKSIQEGIEISKYFELQNQLQFWLPDIYFAQSTEMQTLNNLIKLKTEGLMYWARQMIVTFSNPQMPFYDFPNDQQVFTITLESFSYDSDFIRLLFGNGSTAALTLLTDYQQNDKPLVYNNQIWKYQGFSSFILTTAAPSPTNPYRTYSTAFINIKFSRQSNGVIYRLALPVLIFLVIVGASFWSNENERIEVTLQIILVVAALYVIIGQSIPFVGYLTKMDLFIIAVFAILAVTISVHFLTTLLSRKSSKYPLNSFYRDAMVIIFRGFWMPLSMSIFIGFFGEVHLAFLIILGLFTGGCILFFAGKVKLMVRSYFLSLIRLKIKSDLVVLGALDEKTELPMKLTFTERWTLYLTQVLQRDGRIHISDLFKKYKPGLDCSNGVTGIPSSQPTTVQPAAATMGISSGAANANHNHNHGHRDRPPRGERGGAGGGGQKESGTNAGQSGGVVDERLASLDTDGGGTTTGAMGSGGAPGHVMPQQTRAKKRAGTGTGSGGGGPGSDANSVASKRSNNSLTSLHSAAAQSLIKPHPLINGMGSHDTYHSGSNRPANFSASDSFSDRRGLGLVHQKSLQRGVLPPSFYTKAPIGNSVIGGTSNDSAFVSEGGHFEIPSPNSAKVSGPSTNSPAVGSNSSGTGANPGAGAVRPPFPRSGQVASSYNGFIAVNNSSSNDTGDLEAGDGTPGSGGQVPLGEIGGHPGDLYVSESHADGDYYEVEEDVSVDDTDEDPNEECDQFCEDGEIEALVNFKRTIAKEMGAVFTKRENALQFMANNSIRAKKPLEFTSSFRVKK